MKNLLLFTALCLISAGALRAQEVQESDKSSYTVINFDSLKVAATPEKYAEVQARFEALDDNFTYEDAVMLYYGFVFQPGYKGSGDAMSSPVMKLIQQGKFQKAWDEGVEYLKDNPVSLTTYEGILMAAIRLNKRAEAESYMIRMLAILDLINSTGDGKSANSAFKVLAVSDEYVFMRQLLMINKVILQVYNDGCDIITIDEAENYEGNTIYFDVSIPFQNITKMLEKGDTAKQKKKK